MNTENYEKSIEEDIEKMKELSDISDVTYIFKLKMQDIIGQLKH